MDYKDRLPTDEKIMASIQRYLGMRHTRINAIGDLDPDKITNQQKAGWDLGDIDKYIEELIDDFVNIYGYIYLHGESEEHPRLSRGTNTLEVEMIERTGEIGSIISASDDENISKTFMTKEYALLRIRAKGVPIVSVEELRSENRRQENEYWILPFTRVKGCTFTSDWDGVKYYSVGLERQPLPDIAPEELEQLKAEMISHFPNFLNLVDAYNDAKGKYSLNELRKRQGNYSGEDLQYLFLQTQPLSENYRQKKDEVDSFRVKFNRMLKGLCRQREKDIEQQKEERKKREAEERPIRRVEKEKEEIEQNLTNFEEKVQQTDYFYRQKADRLGIQTTYTEYDYMTEIRQTINKVRSVLKRKTTEQPTTAIYRYVGANLAINRATRHEWEFQEQINAELKEKLNDKVNEIITSYINKKTDKKIEQTNNEKSSWLRRLLDRTKDALQEAKRDNAEAVRDVAIAEYTTNNPENQIEQMIANMYNCASQFGDIKLPEEMQELEVAIRECFIIDEKAIDIARRTYNLPQATLPVLGRKKSIFFRASNEKKEAKRLVRQTEELRSRLTCSRPQEYARPKGQKQFGLGETKLYNQIIEQLNLAYKTIESATEENEHEHSITEPQNLVSVELK